MASRRNDEVPEGTYWLIGLDDESRDLRFPINAPILVGRGSYNHVVLDDSRISRQHSKISPEPDGYVVYDLNSVNGTWVNGVSIKRQRLQPNDVVRFGPYTFRIACEVDPAPAEPGYHVETPTLSGQEAIAEIIDSIDARDSTPNLPVIDLNRLEDAYKKLGKLYSFMQAISTTLDTAELLALIGKKIREMYPTAGSVSIYLRAEPGVQSDDLMLAFYSGEGPFTERPVLPSRVCQAVVETGRAILTTSSPSRRKGGTSMYAPMMNRNDALGVIHVATDESTGGFAQPDLDLLNGMAASAAIMLQNARMHGESLKQDRLNHDLQLAAQIQRSFLPREVVAAEGIEFIAEYRAAYSVGGDFYDVFRVGPDKLAVCIGDVSGKGVSAALLMVRISSELRIAALAQVDPVSVLTTLNAAIIGRAQPELFFTAIYFTLDVKTGEIELANAGHPTPYLCHLDGRFEAISEGTASAVGIFDEPEFQSTRFTLAPGDALVLFTDGVVEASNQEGKLFGLERVEESLARSGPKPGAIVEQLLRSVEQHSAGGPETDDLTLVICSRATGEPPSGPSSKVSRPTQANVPATRWRSRG